MQIQVEKTLDVEVVERQLAELWEQTAGERDADDENAVMRARVANLLVFAGEDAVLEEVRQMLAELTARHPSRVLMMHGDRTAADRDIEMSVDTICQTDKRTGARRLSCEEIALKATGRFVVELPSAALPLLAPDLSTFLWWRSAPQAGDKVLNTLLRASDRLILDSAEFADPVRGLIEINKLYSQDQFRVGISDLNWARLTFWRGLLADFYDVPAYRSLLDGMDVVQIDYAATEHEETSVAPQAWFMAGWLASRLGWKLAEEQSGALHDEVATFNFRPTSPAVKKGSAERTIKLALNRVEQGEHKAGRLVKVELRCAKASEKQAASFVVSRSADNLHVLAEARVGKSTQRGRVLPVRNRSAAHLLSRELEILCNDQMYEEALAVAANMIAHLAQLPAR